MGFDVPFEHDPQADLVGQVEQARVRRVVGGADRVDSHGLHECQVGAGPLFVEDAALVGAHLVAVDAVKGQGRTVRHQHAVLDAHAAESEAQGALRVGEAGPSSHAHAGVVEGGVVRAPRAHGPHGEAAAAVEPVLASLEGEQAGAEAVDLEATHQGVFLGAEHPGLDARVADPGLVVGVDPQILDRAVGEVTQADGAEDSGQPPLILVLQVRTGAELVDAHGDPVEAGAHGPGHVELVGQA